MITALPYFKFNGIKSLDEQLLITGKNTYKGAARDLTFQSIPGRSGDLLIDNRRYKNVKITYDVTALGDKREISDIARRVKNWLLSEIGYFRLYDTYDQKYFRIAAFQDEFDLEQELPEVGSSTIAFNCKPFRYSHEGQKSLVLSSAATIRNPERFPASPYIKITGSGDITLTVNENAFVFKDVSDYIEIDSEIMQAFKGTQSENAKMYTPTFPTLTKGENTIAWSGSVSSVEIIPRWCCL